MPHNLTDEERKVIEDRNRQLLETYKKQSLLQRVGGFVQSHIPGAGSTGAVDEKPKPQNPLHEPAWIVMKLKTGELSEADKTWLAENLDKVKADHKLMEQWSHVNFGAGVSAWFQQLDAVAKQAQVVQRVAEAPPFVIDSKWLVEPKSDGTKVYKVKEYDRKTDTVSVDATPDFVYPAGMSAADIKTKISRELKDAKLREQNQRVREILSGSK